MKTRPESQESGAEIQVPPPERIYFRALMLANPNHFGTSLEANPLPPVKVQSGNTTYEQLNCVGYNPALNQLKGVVIIKQDGGYNGSLCTAGSQEYVRFYLSFDNGATWEDEGVASFVIHDDPGSRPLDFAVTVTPQSHGTFCSHESLPLVRAILSWNALPPANTPGFVPVWGNVVQAHIQIRPQPLYYLGDLLGSLKKALPVAVDAAATVPVAQAKPLSPAALLASYQGKSVQVHRALYPQVHRFIADAEFSEAYASYGSKGPLAGLDVDLAAIIAAINQTQGDTGYEQLNCVGLDPNGTANLAATFTIKRASGYLGSQCQTGSQEYVAFFIDWLDGSGYHWVGTAQATVHDFSTIPADGLQYSVSQPVDLTQHLQTCDKGPVYAKVRAILSWDVAPPPSNPNYVPVWGNHVDGLIEIEPGVAVPIGDYTPYLEGVCGVAACSIDPSTGFAPGDRPFGGGVAIYGYIPGAPKLGATTTYPVTTGLPRYRLKVRQLPAGAPQYLNDSFGVTLEQQIGGGLPTSQGVAQSVDADSYYTYLNVTPDPAAGWQESFPSHLLTVWNTAGKTGLWEISMEAYDPVSHTTFPAGSTACSGGGLSTTLVIDLDNAAPVTALAITGFSRDGGPIQPAADCSSFQQGDVIYGTYSVTDEHFGSLSLEVEPAGPANGAVVQLSIDNFTHVFDTSRSYPTVPTGGESGQWRLDTTDMDPCGYTVQLQSSDRTIANCVGPWENNNAFVGFCLVAPPAAN